MYHWVPPHLFQGYLVFISGLSRRLGVAEPTRECRTHPRRPVARGGCYRDGFGDSPGVTGTGSLFPNESLVNTLRPFSCSRYSVSTSVPSLRAPGGIVAPGGVSSEVPSLRVSWVRAQSTAVCVACQRVTCASVGRVLGRNAERTAAAPALSQLGWLSLRCGALSRSSSQISKHSRWNRVSCQSSASILTVMVSSGRIGVPHPSQVCLVPGPHDNSTEFSCGRRPSQRRRWMSCRISVASI
jgi:hypothetical protein